MDIVFEREDWKLFRNMETLTQKAGVPKSKISMLVCKELVDNALDMGGACETGYEGDLFYVKDNGPGLEPGLFSINRPLRSSKYLRLPTRGALGNGLRVVAGAIAATGGELYVSTRGRRYQIDFLSDGTAQPQDLGAYNATGTKISFHLGAMSINTYWADQALQFAQGESYRGKTSPWWYTSENFYELLQSFDGTAAELIRYFDGCTGGKAAQIIAQYQKTPAAALRFDETETLLAGLRAVVKNVRPERLGRIGELGRAEGYCKTTGAFRVRTVKGRHNAEIPYVLETYAVISDKPAITVLINKSPITGEGEAYHHKNMLHIFGCGLGFQVKAKSAAIRVNLMTPYIPIVTDGKEPDLSVIRNEIGNDIIRATGKAQKIKAASAIVKIRSQKEIVAECLHAAVAKASGDGRYRFSLRQLYYAVRPYVMRETGKAPEYKYFCREMIGDYEAQHGDIPLMYRDERGTLYHPHLGADIAIGTIAVENYRKPAWTFNKVLYIEKEGFFQVLKENKIPEKYDMALLTSKGYASRAVKDLLDGLAQDAAEEITFFCIHDADAYGTTIYDALQNETKARPGRRVNIINLGLDPEEAVAMGLEVEEVEKAGRRKGVADYIDPVWEEWLQYYRVELNAMSTPQFLDWLESKIQSYDQGKVIPPASVMQQSLDDSLGQILNRVIADEILEQNDYRAKVEAALTQVKQNCGNDLAGDGPASLSATVKTKLAQEPVRRWQDVVQDVSAELVKNCRF